VAVAEDLRERRPDHLRRALPEASGDVRGALVVRSGARRVLREARVQGRGRADGRV